MLTYGGFFKAFRFCKKIVEHYLCNKLDGLAGYAPYDIMVITTTIEKGLDWRSSTYFVKKMSKYVIFRVACVALLWLILCYILITRSAIVDFRVVFAIIASGIVVFVPMYKKYKRGK